MPAQQGDFRARMPRFTPQNLSKNRKVVEALSNLAGDKGIRSAQLAIAWVLAKEKNIVPVIGARTRAQLSESLAALEVQLNPAELDRIAQEIRESSVAGARYDEHQMKMLDSEK
jgi:aryl-alcohol dehydrogenase-like predicted oxidoreductase